MLFHTAETLHDYDRWWRVDFALDWSSSRRADVVISLPPPTIEPWLAEARRIPRRMKRPFPADNPHKPRAHRRACY